MQIYDCFYNHTCKMQEVLCMWIKLTIVHIVFAIFSAASLLLKKTGWKVGSLRKGGMKCQNGFSVVTCKFQIPKICEINYSKEFKL